MEKEKSGKLLRSVLLAVVGTFIVSYVVLGAVFLLGVGGGTTLQGEQIFGVVGAHGRAVKWAAGLAVAAGLLSWIAGARRARG